MEIEIITDEEGQTVFKLRGYPPDAVIQLWNHAIDLRGELLAKQYDQLPAHIKFPSIERRSHRDRRRNNNDEPGKGSKTDSEPDDRNQK